MFCVSLPAFCSSVLSPRFWNLWHPALVLPSRNIGRKGSHPSSSARKLGEDLSPLLFQNIEEESGCLTAYIMIWIQAFISVCVCVRDHSLVVREGSLHPAIITSEATGWDAIISVSQPSLTSIIPLLSVSNGLNPFSCWWLGDYPGSCFRITSKCIWTVEFTYCFPPKSFLAWSSWDGFTGRTIICGSPFWGVEINFPKDESQLRSV